MLVSAVAPLAVTRSRAMPVLPKKVKRMSVRTRTSFGCRVIATALLTLESHIFIDSVTYLEFGALLKR